MPGTCSVNVCYYYFCYSSLVCAFPVPEGGVKRSWAQVWGKCLHWRASFRRGIRSLLLTLPGITAIALARSQSRSHQDLLSLRIHDSALLFLEWPFRSWDTKHRLFFHKSHRIFFVKWIALGIWTGFFYPQLHVRQTWSWGENKMLPFVYWALISMRSGPSPHCLPSMPLRFTLEGV